MAAPSVWILLRPRVQGLQNQWRRASRGQRWAIGFFACLGLLFWLTLLGLCSWVLFKFQQVEVFGPLLMRQAMRMLFAFFFGMLSFSTIISALSNYYLAQDLFLVNSLPLSPRQVFYSRFVDSLFGSSWMLAIFALPVLIAFGIVHGAGPGYYLLALALGPGFLLVPASLGVLIATSLVYLFPAHRTRQVMVALGACFAVGMFLLLRWLRPEQLVSAQDYSTVAQFMSDLDNPWLRKIPSGWFTEPLLATLGYRVQRPWLSAGLLFCAGPASAVLARIAVSPVYFGGFSRSQEAAPARMARSVRINWLLEWITRPFPPVLRAMLRKDTRVFVRDAAQWSQVFLLLGLVGIYLYNVYVLPVEQWPLGRQLADVISFLNIGMAGFVLAGLSVRLNYPSVSTEGRAFWVLQAAPIRGRQFLIAKAIFGAVPLALLGVGLIIASNFLLGVAPLVQVVSGITIFVLAFVISAMAVGFGALYPDFKADSAERVASSPGAILYMVTASFTIALVIILESAGLLVVLRARYREIPIGGFGWGIIVVCGLLVLAVCATAALVPLRRGERALWAE